MHTVWVCECVRVCVCVKYCQKDGLLMGDRKLSIYSKIFLQVLDKKINNILRNNHDVSYANDIFEIYNNKNQKL